MTYENKEIVFGIGMQKSSVTSLINALKILGYKGAQYDLKILLRWRRVKKEKHSI